MANFEIRASRRLLIHWIVYLSGYRFLPRRTTNIIAMVSLAAIWGVGILAASSLLSTATAATKAPDGCRKLNSDTDWPMNQQWEAALPGVIKRSRGGGIQPDYRYRVKAAEDVQRAVRFAKDNNIRVSVVASGHELQGRSSAASGLLIDISQLNGINVLRSFTPTPEGTPKIEAGQIANIITPLSGVQAAVTVGGATPGQFLNDALSKSKLFAVGGADGMMYCLILLWLKTDISM